MEYYSSKICKKCYSAQEPAARFCDNCGKPFMATAATDGNISIITKAFIKKQVAETRPLFWLCIIIVGLLAVFGFAQAGLYLIDPSPSGAEISRKPTTLMSKDTPEQPRTSPASTETQPSDALIDLNNSVFEMGDARTSQTQKQAKTRRHVTINARTTAQLPPAASESKEQTGKSDNAASDWTPPTEKAPEVKSAPKKYIRGPMGGCYYMTPSGSKHYVDRGLCS
jgi:hypothetical protein